VAANCGCSIPSLAFVAQKQIFKVLAKAFKNKQYLKLL
jgi:hypothetical protein